MDDTAIKLIQQTAIDANNDRLPSDVAANVAALPNDYKLVDLEHLQSGRRRYRGRFTTTSLADFVAFVVAAPGTPAGTEHKQGFINPNDYHADVYFNLGTCDEPGHGDHTASLQMKPTAPWNALLQTDGKAYTQAKLIEFLEDWAPHITALGPTLDDEKPLAQAIAAIRQVTIKQVSEQTSTREDFRENRSSMEDIEAKSALGLPAGFRFRATPFHGLAEQEATLRLSVLTTHDKPMLALRIQRREALDEAILQDFKATLFAEIGDAASLTIGTFTP